MENLTVTRMCTIAYNLFKVLNSFSLYSYNLVFEKKYIQLF